MDLCGTLGRTTRLSDCPRPQAFFKLSGQRRTPEEETSARMWGTDFDLGGEWPQIQTGLHWGKSEMGQVRRAGAGPCGSPRCVTEGAWWECRPVRPWQGSGPALPLCGRCFSFLSSCGLSCPVPEVLFSVLSQFKFYMGLLGDLCDSCRWGEKKQNVLLWSDRSLHFWWFSKPAFLLGDKLSFGCIINPWNHIAVLTTFKRNH